MFRRSNHDLKRDSKLTLIKAPAYRRYARGAQKCYKPITTRLPFLAGILILTLALIAIVEIVLRQYPVDSDLGTLAAPNITRRFVYEASEDRRIGLYGAHQDGNIKARVPSTFTANSSALFLSADSSTSVIRASSQTGASPSSRPSLPILSSDAPAYVTTSTPSISSNTDPLSYPSISTTGSAASIPFTVITEVLTTGPSAYIPPTTSSFPPNTDPSAYDPITPVSEISSAGTLSMDRTQTTAYVPPTASLPQTAPSGYAPTYASIPSANTPTTQPLSVVTTITLPSDPPVSTTFTTTPGEYIPTGPTVGGASSVDGPQNGGGTLSTAPGATVPTDPANTGVSSQLAIIPTSTINDPNVMATSLVPIATHTSGGMAVVVLGSLSTPVLVPVSTYTSNGVALVVVGTPSKTSLVPVSTYTSNGAAYVVMGTPSKTPLVPVSTYTSNGAAYVVMGTPSKTSLVPVSTYTSNGAAYVVMGTPSKTSLVPISTMTSDGVAVVVLGLATSQPTDPAILPSSYSVVVEQVTSTSGSVAYVYLTTLTLGPSQLASLTATAAAPQYTAATTSDQQKTTIAFTNVSYFAAWYLPTMVAVAFRVLWTVVYNNARLMEPFYRLASPAGVTGRDALDNL
jgi:hypothetical protein